MFDKYLELLAEPGLSIQHKSNGLIISIRAAQVGDEYACAAFLDNEYLDMFSMLISPADVELIEGQHEQRLYDLLNEMRLLIERQLG